MKKLFHISVILTFILALAQSTVLAHTEDAPFMTDLIVGGGNKKSAMDVGDVLVWNDAGTLNIKSGATVTQDVYRSNFFDVEAGGLLQVDGAGSSISVKVLNFLGGAMPRLQVMPLLRQLRRHSKWLAMLRRRRGIPCRRSSR